MVNYPYASPAGQFQAIILAAGCGSRLGDANERRPKCLAQVNGERLIDHQLAALSAVGITDICVVTGYEANAVRSAIGHRAHLRHNSDWATTNSIYSLAMCRDWVRHSVVVMNCDVLVHPEVLVRLLAHRCSSFAFDSASGDDPEHMKVELVGGCLKAMSKALPAQRTSGENVGVLCFKRDAAQQLFFHTRLLIKAGGRNFWLASAVERVAKHLPIAGVDVYGLPWIEIDFKEDLDRARRWVGPAIDTSLAPVDVALMSATA